MEKYTKCQITIWITIELTAFVKDLKKLYFSMTIKRIQPHVLASQESKQNDLNIDPEL